MNDVNGKKLNPNSWFVYTVTNIFGSFVGMGFGYYNDKKRYVTFSGTTVIIADTLNVFDFLILPEELVPEKYKDLYYSAR